MYSSHHHRRRHGLEQLGMAVSSELDPRLADVWVEIFKMGLERDVESPLGWLVRMAYLTGYRDGQEEAEGELLEKVRQH